MEIYLVHTENEIEGYHVVAAFSTREAAVECQQILKAGLEITSIELDPDWQAWHGVPELLAGLSLYVIDMKPDLSILHTYCHSNPDYQDILDTEGVRWHRSMKTGMSCRDLASVVVWASNEEDAVHKAKQMMQAEIAKLPPPIPVIHKTVQVIEYT